MGRRARGVSAPPCAHPTSRQPPTNKQHVDRRPHPHQAPRGRLEAGQAGARARGRGGDRDRALEEEQRGRRAKAKRGEGGLVEEDHGRGSCAEGAGGVSARTAGRGGCSAPGARGPRRPPRLALQDSWHNPRGAPGRAAPSAARRAARAAPIGPPSLSTHPSSTPPPIARSATAPTAPGAGLAGAAATARRRAPGRP